MTTTRGKRVARLVRILLVMVLLLQLGCSVKKFAIGKLGDALASGGSVYQSDDDLELVAQALPFGLKLIESLLAEVPDHSGLLLAACEGFTAYSYAFIQQDADEMTEIDLASGRRLRDRARKLYLRARGYGLRGLEVAHKGTLLHLDSDPEMALSVTKKRDLPLIYWNAAALGLAISASRGDAEMLAHLPELGALVDRGLELDEKWNEGTFHEIAIVLAGARPDVQPLDLEGVQAHFERASELSGGKRASLFVLMAENVSIRSQDAMEFRSLLDEALTIDPDDYPEIRLSNLVAQRRARWLMSRTEELFLNPEGVDTLGGGER